MVVPPKTAAKAAVGTAAAVSGGYGFLLGEALWARHRIGTTDEVPPAADGVYGDDLPGVPIRCLLMGDSTAVGYGMKRADQTPPALVAIGLAHLLDSPVDIRSVAKVGARSAALADQVARGKDHEPQLVIILIGANDVTHQVTPARSARLLADAVRQLRDLGAEVVVGTCPDLGTIKPMPQPLRQVARLWSRRLARAQTVAAVQAGARSVSMADLLGPIYLLKGDTLFGDDRFHPSEMGYANMASFLVAASAAAWRERNHDVEYVGAPRDFMSVTQAATEASEHAGTQVAPEGRWASVMRRRR